MRTKTIPLVGSLIARSLAISTNIDQRFVNGFPEVTVNPITQSATVFFLKRPGTAGTNCAGASYIGTSGSVIWSGFSTGAKGAFCFLNGTTLQVWDSGFAQIGGNVPVGAHTGFTNQNRLSETAITNTATLVLLAKDSADGFMYGYKLTEGGAWAEITAGAGPAFPPNQATKLMIVGNAVHMDGYMFVMDTQGNIWNSDINSVLNWTNTNQFVNAQIYPDGGCGLARIKNIIIAFGTQSVEFFQNVGNATGSPLARIASAAVKIGAVRSAFQNAETIKVIGDICYFIGIEGDTQRLGVYSINGYQVTKISTPAIDKYLQFTQINGITAGISGGMMMNGQVHVVLAVEMNTTVLIPVYCVDTKIWWYMGIAGNGAQSNSRVTACLGLNGESYFTSSSNGSSQGRKLFVTTASTLGYADDDGTAYTMSIQTEKENYNESGYGAQFKRLEVLCDTQTTSGDMTISSSDDDYATFVTRGTIDTSSGAKRINRLGSTQRNFNNARSWNFTETISRPFRGTGFTVWWDDRTA